MTAYTAETARPIEAVVDHINITIYDLMNRRDSVTKHHTGIAGSLEAVDNYLAPGFSPKKLLLGFAFYSKRFTAEANSTCGVNALGCQAVVKGDVTVEIVD